MKHRAAAVSVLAIALTLSARPTLARSTNACPATITACGRTITTTGVYVVGNPLTESTAGVDCLDIDAKDVDLETDGMSITGPNSGAGSGIFIEKKAKN